jgi:hypothetical protein
MVPPDPSGMLIEDCAGNVVVENVLLDSYGWYGFGVRIEGCANVVLRGCDVLLGSSPLEIVDSNVVLTTTGVHQTAPFQNPFPPYTIGYTNSVPALSMQNSTVTLIGSIVRGGWVWGSSGNAKPAAILANSTLRIGPATSLLGAFLGGNYYVQAYTSPNPSLCVVERDPRSTVNWTLALNPPPTPTTIDSVFHGWLVAGQPFGVTVAGPTNGFALLAFGDLSTAPAPTPWGLLAATPSSAFVVDLVALTHPEGFHQWILDCPITAPIATPFVFQALTLSPSGAMTLTEPSPIVVGWPFGVPL